MPHVGFDGSPLHERLIYGTDGSHYRPIVVDASGNLEFVPVTGATFTVVQSNPADLKATVNVAAGQSIEVTQDTASNLNARVGNQVTDKLWVQNNDAADLLATVNMAASQNILARLQGYYSGGWRNAPSPFGPTAPLGISWSNTNLSAGTNIVQSQTVPASTLWVITNVVFFYVGTVPTAVQVAAYISGATISIWQQQGPNTTIYYDKQMQVVLASGDAIQLVVYGATAGDNLYGRAVGYTMSVA